MHVDRDPMPIIDAHHHLWNLQGSVHYPWLSENRGSIHADHSAIRRSYLPEDYRRDAILHNVVGSVHVEAEADRAQEFDETRWLEAMHRDCGMPDAIVAHSWVDTPDAEAAIAKQAASPLVRGIRTKPVTSSAPHQSVAGIKRSIQDPIWRRGLNLLPAYGLSWDLRVPYWHLSEIAELLHELPAFPVALNHAGYPRDRSAPALAIWRQGMKALAAHEHVHCKISALGAQGQPWTLDTNQAIIDEVIDTFGAHRCMFASNFPVDGLMGSLDYIYSSFKRAVASRSNSERLAMFAGNAKRFYRLDVAVDPAAQVLRSD